MIDQDIARVQKSTRTTVAGLVPLHNKLRMRYSWYYNWHLNSYANKLHLLILALYMVGIGALGVAAFKTAQPQSVKAATSWRVCGTTSPGEPTSNNGIFAENGTFNGKTAYQNPSGNWLYWNTDLNSWIIFSVLTDMFPPSANYYGTAGQELPASPWLGYMPGGVPTVVAGDQDCPGIVTQCTATNAGNSSYNGTYTHVGYDWNGVQYYSNGTRFLLSGGFPESYWGLFEHDDSFVGGWGLGMDRMYDSSGDLPGNPWGQGPGLGSAPYPTLTCGSASPTPTPIPSPSPSPSIVPSAVPSPSPTPTAAASPVPCNTFLPGETTQEHANRCGPPVICFNVSGAGISGVNGSYTGHTDTDSYYTRGSYWAGIPTGGTHWVISEGAMPGGKELYINDSPDWTRGWTLGAEGTGSVPTISGQCSSEDPTPNPSSAPEPTCIANNSVVMSISPDPAYLRPSSTSQLSAEVLDSCGDDISKSCTIVWSVLNSNVGTISQTGLFSSGASEGNFARSIKATADCSGQTTFDLSSVVITTEARRLESALFSPFSFKKVRKGTDPDTVSWTLTGYDQFLNRFAPGTLAYSSTVLDNRLGSLLAPTNAPRVTVDTSNNYGCYYGKVKGDVSYRDVTKTALSSLYIYPPEQTSFVPAFVSKALAQTTSSRYFSFITMNEKYNFQPTEAYRFVPIPRDQFGSVMSSSGIAWTLTLNDPNAGIISPDGNFIATTTPGYYPKAFSVRGVNGEHTVVITRDITVSDQRRQATTIKVWINDKLDTTNTLNLTPNGSGSYYAQLYDQFGDFVTGPMAMRPTKLNPSDPFDVSGLSVLSTSSQSGTYQFKLSFAIPSYADVTQQIDGPSPELLLSVDVNSTNETDPGACLLSTPDQSPTVNSPTPSPIVSQTITQIPDPSVTPTDSRTTVPAIASPTGTPTTSQTPSVEESRTPVVGVTISSVPPGSGSSPTGLGSVIETIVKPFTSSESQSPVTTAVLTALAAAAAVPAAIASSSVFPVFLDLMRWPIVILSRLKKRPKWGVVYDAISKQPLSGVMVRIFDNNKRLRETIYTGKDGAFGFLADAGSYTITASKYGYTFPSNIVPGKADNQYQSVYHGEPLELSESITKIDQTVPIHVSIPLDLNYLSAEKKARVAGSLALKRALDYARIPVLVIGTILAIDVLIIKNRWWDYLIMAVYAILWIYEIKEGTRPKMFGSVYDEQGNHINLPIIRAFDHMGRIKATVIGRQDGKFTMNLEPGVYTFEVSRLGYETYKSGKTKIASITDLGKLRFSLHKKPLS